MFLRLQADDRDAFEDFYRQQTGRVYAICLRLTANRSQAEEMTQEVFVRAWNNRGSFKSLAHARNWLQTVALNLWRNDMRTRARRGEPLELDPERHADRGVSEGGGPGSRGIRVDLERAVATLPTRAREVLVLHDVYGFKHREIADSLGMAVNTSKVQLHRARKRLREVMSV